MLFFLHHATLKLLLSALLDLIKNGENYDLQSFWSFLESSKTFLYADLEGILVLFYQPGKYSV